MKFNSLHIYNFMSLDYASFELQDQGLVGVFGNNLDTSGSNGSGKSAIFDAIIWALYGRTTRGLTGDSVIKSGEDSVSVYVVFRCKEDYEYECCIKRQKHKGKAASIYIEDKPVTQEDLTKFIGLDYKSFVSLIMFGPENARFTRSSDSEQKAILDKVLGLEVYEEAYKIIKDKKKKIDQLILEKEATLKAINENIVKTTDRVKERNEIFAQHSEFNAKQQELLKPILEELAGYKDQLKFIELLAKEKVRNKEFEKKITDNDKNLHKLNLEICKLLGNKCYVCEQKLSSESMAILSKNKEEEYNDLVMKDAIDREVFDESNLTIKLLSNQIDPNCDEVIQCLEKSKDQIIRSLYNLDTEIEINQELKSMLDSFIARKIELASELSEIRKESKEVDFWAEAFGNGGIKSYILDSVLPFLTKQTNKYLAELSNNSIEVEFKSQKALASGELREKLTIEVKNLYGGEGYDSNSSGEKQRIDIAIALALRDLIAERLQKDYGFTVFDELFEHLDPSGCENVISLMRKNSNNGTTFLITHNPVLQEQLERKHILVTKEKGSSICTVKI